MSAGPSCWREAAGLRSSLTRIEGDRDKQFCPWQGVEFAGDTRTPPTHLPGTHRFVVRRPTMFYKGTPTLNLTDRRPAIIAVVSQKACFEEDANAVSPFSIRPPLRQRHRRDGSIG